MVSNLQSSDVTRILGARGRSNEVRPRFLSCNLYDRTVYAVVLCPFVRCAAVVANVLKISKKMKVTLKSPLTFLGSARKIGDGRKYTPRGLSVDKAS